MNLSVYHAGPFWDWNLVATRTPHRVVCQWGRWNFEYRLMVISQHERAGLVYPGQTAKMG